MNSYSQTTEKAKFEPKKEKITPVKSSTEVKKDQPVKAVDKTKSADSTKTSTNSGNKTESEKPTGSNRKFVRKQPIKVSKKKLDNQ